MPTLQIISGTDTPPTEEWKPIASAPFGKDLELCVIDAEGPHALVFPCRRVLHGWIESGTQRRLDVSPTHWRLYPA